MEEWVVEYIDSGSRSTLWKRSEDWDIGALPPMLLEDPPMLLEEAMKKARSKEIKNTQVGLKYRIRNTRTDDIIPAAMFL